MQTIDEVEQSLIGALVCAPRQVVRAVEFGTSASWFVTDKYSLMWSAIESFWKRGDIDGMNAVTAMAEAKRLSSLEGEKRDAASLTIADIERGIDLAPTEIVPTLVLMRNGWIERCSKAVVGEAFSHFPEYGDAKDVVIAARNALDRIASGICERDRVDLKTIFAGLMDEYQEAHRMRVDAAGPRDLTWTPGIKMPWPKMTGYMNGLRPGLHIVAARPSVGKTAFAVNLMRFWCEQGLRVTWCALDMPQVEAMRRFVAELSRVSIRKASYTPTKTDLDAMQKACDRILTNWKLEVVDIRDVDDLCADATIAHYAGKLDILVIDYLQQLHARALGKEDGNEYVRVSYVSGRLKELASKLNIPVVSLAQLNRDVAKSGTKGGRAPGLADLRGSGAIEQDAYTVMILHRDEDTLAKWRKGGENAEKARRLIPGTLNNPTMRCDFTDIDAVWWILAKAQNGPTFRLPFVVRKNYFAWMLGDYEAEAKTTTSGYGAAQTTSVDNSAFFEKVHSDWRHDPLEDVLWLQLALIRDQGVVQNVES